eukprot:m.443355 g.443355  ORF g.443355 m.443355 type:complete len:52 (-) comp137897_c0_seq1:4-159(-)
MFCAIVASTTQPYPSHIAKKGNDGAHRCHERNYNETYDVPIARALSLAIPL